MYAITYARVATVGQEKGENPLDIQEQAYVDFAQARGWGVVESVRDVASGLSLDRPGIERVRYLFRSKSADVLVTGALDRLAREPRKVLGLVDEIEKVGVRLEAVTDRLDDPAVRRLALSIRVFAVEAQHPKRQSRSEGAGRCA
jgi:DNA invertase Pin-like site-specific DNA recombinase